MTNIVEQSYHFSEPGKIVTRIDRLRFDVLFQAQEFVFTSNIC